MSTVLNNFGDGYRTNHITMNSISAGKNVELLNTPYGRGIYMSNGNALINQIPNEKIIGGFDYVKGNIHHHLS